MLGLVLALTVAAPPPQSLIDRLGADAAADREQAGRELTGVGPDAVPALQRAAGSHPDAEVRRRAAELAERIAHEAETAARLVVAPIRLDYRREPLAKAVADLRGRTGIPLTLGEGVADPARPVTVQAGELPPWEAVERFCRAADLREEVRAEVPLAPSPVEPLVTVRRRTPTVGPFHPEAPALVPVVLIDGTSSLPGDRSGGVRVQAVPADFPGHRVIRGIGVTQLALDVSPLPVLAGGGRWEEITRVRVTRAEDEHGRAVQPAHHAPAEPDADLNQIGLGGWVVFGGGLAAPNLLAPPFGELTNRPLTRPNPRLATVSLHTADRPIRSLSVLEGSVHGEVTLPNQPLVTIDDLNRAARHGSGGLGDVRLAVLSVTTDAAGRTTVRVRVDLPNPWTFPKANRGVNLLNVAAGQPMLYGPIGSPAAPYRFSDAAGRPANPSGFQTGATGDDGFRQSAELEFRFDRRDGAGPPVRLVLVGEKTVAVEVPFRLRDVPLP